MRNPERVLLYAMIVGILAGGFSGYAWGENMMAVGWLGDLFLTALRMMIVPLVAASVITGVTALGDVRRLGRLGGLSVAYYATTTFIAVGIGLLMANLWQPGVGVPLGELTAPAPQVGDIGVTDLILSLVHPNIIGAGAEMKLLPIIVFSIFLQQPLPRLGSGPSPSSAFLMA